METEVRQRKTRKEKAGIDTGASMVDEKSDRKLLFEVLLPLLVAGMGMVTAGLTLDTLQNQEIFRLRTEIFILIPALLGLKGNLEMTLASRLSTLVNLGIFDEREKLWQAVWGNLALIQVQAAAVGLFASLVALLMSASSNFSFMVLVSMLTASLATSLLSVVMVLVIVLVHKAGSNPDNIATPLAAALGDLVTLIILTEVSKGVFWLLESSQSQSVLTALSASYVILVVCCSALAARNSFTREALQSGWTPVIGAMVISSCGGCILRKSVVVFPQVAVYQPIINGVGGNLSSVLASRMSTSLHKINKCVPTYTDSRLLLLLVVPVHSLLLFFTYYLHLQTSTPYMLNTIFVTLYLSACFIQVLLLLLAAGWLVPWLWQRGVDPDNAAIPYLTSMGDLLGTALLTVAFYATDIMAF